VPEKKRGMGGKNPNENHLWRKSSVLRNPELTEGKRKMWAFY